MAKGASKVVWGVGIIVVVIALFGSGILSFSTTPIQGSGQPPSSGNNIAAALSASGYDPLAAAGTNVNVELWSGTLGGTTGRVVGETQANAALTSISTNLPNTFTGYLMVGNDNFVSTSDRGTEYYYRESPITWTTAQGLLSFPDGVADKIPTFAEGTLTDSFYDGGTVESTANVSIGSGATVTNTEIRMQVSANGAYGNPQLSNPILACFNQSANAAVLDYIRPQSFTDIVTAPKSTQAMQILGGECYVLPTSALIDNAGVLSGPYSAYNSNPQAYRFFITIKALSGKNPGTSDSSFFIPFDKTYFKDDLGNWQIGWGKDSLVGSSTDIGSSDFASNTLTINFE